jgi:hypothetical protein
MGQKTAKPQAGSKKVKNLAPKAEQIKGGERRVDFSSAHIVDVKLPK